MDMARSEMFSIAFLVLLLLIMESATMTIASPADVNIWNAVGEPIQVHCFSGDDGFDERTLGDGQHFRWGFNPNVWGTTAYYCSFTWDAHHKRLRVWVDYKLFSRYDSDHRPCTHCVWRVTKEGFYRMTSDIKEVLPVFESGWLV